ncbi:hypothetical protein [Lentzea sp. HUAS12]|uniref:hypothetical protein n=1 Tax=Lentzea sp. HUAS12 TaxID=2951806 RepID=UPI00209FB693|nr:hypothetical protein [Lentzea sp. HUAS12]USX56349.1 hypothetical protein ND450_20280 [Lentzea sp. HUAS12]
MRTTLQIAILRLIQDGEKMGFSRILTASTVAFAALLGALPGVASADVVVPPRGQYIFARFPGESGLTFRITCRTATAGATAAADIGWRYGENDWRATSYGVATPFTSTYSRPNTSTKITFVANNLSYDRSLSCNGTIVS